MNYALAKYLTAQFYAWEHRGRGWQAFEQPVELEPEFIPFFGHLPPETKTGMDDGRRPRFFPRLQEALGVYRKPESVEYGDEAVQELEERYPLKAYQYDRPDEITELQVNFDKDTRIVFENIDQLLLMLSTCESIVAFEVLGTAERVTIQFVCPKQSTNIIRSHILAYAPGVVITESATTLQDLLDSTDSLYVHDLGLRDEFMRPLRVWQKFDPDPLAGCIAALESLEPGEVGLLQVLFQSAVNPWAESIYRSVTDGSGGAFFSDSEDMLPLTKEKISAPLFATVIRTAGQASSDDKAIAISESLSKSLIAFHRSGSNTLIPLTGSPSCDLEDILLRRSKRIGMLLNSNELASMVHIPDRSVVSPKLRVYTGKTKKAPNEVIGHSYELGFNSHLGQESTVSLSLQHRLRHMHVIGATGTGKSSLLLKLITQDIARGEGITVLDPHGDLIDEIVSHVPDERLQDVILVDPSDSEYPIGLNLLSAHSDAEQIILSSDLVALFRRFATSWGDQMTSVLANAVNAILESREGGTLIDLRRFLVEKRFRDKFLETVSDPNIIYYWKHEFSLLRKNSIAPILTRLDTFLRPRIVRNMMAQKEGLDFNDVLNNRKILLVKLAQGLIGEENSYLLGTLIVAKLHQAAQARQIISKDERLPHFFYIDEFQNFITPSMASILSGARKYGLGLILAHQDLEQLSRRDSELTSSVLSNPAVRVCFRCGDKDASRLEDGFSYFDSTDLQSLGVGQAVVRVGRKDHDFNLSFSLVPTAQSAVSKKRLEAIVDHCRSTHSLHKSDVEKILGTALEIIEEAGPANKPERKPAEKHPDPEEKPQTEEIKVDAESKGELEAEALQFVAKETEREEIREHRYLQEYVKKIAEARNFKAVLEQPVNDNTGNVDVSLHHNDLKIACEISVMNTAEYEVQNIQKCFVAGYQIVFMLSNDPKHLGSIRDLAVEHIDETLHKRLYFVSKEGFVQQLDLILSRQVSSTETRTRGYRVKVRYGESSGTSDQRNVLKDVILSAFRRKHGEDKDGGS